MLKHGLQSLKARAANAFKRLTKNRKQNTFVAKKESEKLKAKLIKYIFHSCSDVLDCTVGGRAPIITRVIYSTGESYQLAVSGVILANVGHRILWPFTCQACIFSLSHISGS